MKKLFFIMAVCVLFLFACSSLAFSKDNSNGPTKKETAKYIETLIIQQGVVGDDVFYEIRVKKSSCRLRLYENKGRNEFLGEFDLKYITEIILSAKTDGGGYSATKANGESVQDNYPFILFVGPISWEERVEKVTMDFQIYCGDSIERIYKAFVHLWEMYRTEDLF